MRSRLACSLAIAAGLTGCGGSHAVSVSVNPSTGLADAPERVTIFGLDAHTPATMTLRSVDADGVAWTATARVRNARVDLAQLVRSLQPSRPLVAYAWRGARPFAFTLRLRSHGDVLATTTFRRRYATTDRTTTATPTLAADGFVGGYFAPARTRRGPAVLVIGGSGG